MPKPVNPLLAQVHIAKKQLGYDDETYRDVLDRVIGKRSSAGLKDAQLRLVLTEFQRLGWDGKISKGKGSAKAYVRKIYALWSDLKRRGLWQGEGRASLNAFVAKMTGKMSPDFLTFDEASPVIEALKDMGKRADA